MEYLIRKVKNSDESHIISIINYFCESSFAAYSEKRLDFKFFNKLKETSISFYIIQIENKLSGFFCLRKYMPYDTFNHTGLLTYFIMPKYTNRGFGELILEKLIKDAKKNGIHILLVNISSKNSQSISFHRKHGFLECGRLRNVGKKFNQYFDIIWMQKNLND